MLSDRNFDDLAPRFARNIYSTMKGKIRLQVLRRDFEQYIPDLMMDGNRGEGWSVLDAGAGQGQFSLALARSGCKVVLNDLSKNMLSYAQKQLDELVEQNAVQQGRVRVVHGPLQALCKNKKQYDLVICHAVMEWVAEPRRLLDYLAAMTKEGGYLSLIFYNFNGLAFKNLLRTNFYKFDYNNFKAFRGSLTPTHPQRPRDVITWLGELGYDILCKSGIRVFNDYILDPDMRARDEQGVLEKELEYSRREPFWEMARYIHFFSQKK